MLKFCLQDLVSSNIIDPNIDTKIIVQVDEQLTSSNGIYNLEQSIYEEFKHGILNFNYGTIHPKIFNKNLIVKVIYCDSKHNYLIQASDIIANRVFSAIRNNKPQLIPKNKHYIKYLP